MRRSETWLSIKSLPIGYFFFALRFGFFTVSCSSLGRAGRSITRSICSAAEGSRSLVASVPSYGSLALRVEEVPKQRGENVAEPRRKKGSVSFSVCGSIFGFAV